MTPIAAVALFVYLAGFALFMSAWFTPERPRRPDDVAAVLLFLLWPVAIWFMPPIFDIDGDL
jgi:fatty acid desaturase